jgi:hypothetical protein
MAVGVAVAMWQWVGWIGNVTVIILRGDFFKKDTGSGSGSGSGTKKTAPLKNIYIYIKSTHQKYMFSYQKTPQKPQKPL